MVPGLLSGKEDSRPADRGGVMVAWPCCESWNEHALDCPEKGSEMSEELIIGGNQGRDDGSFVSLPYRDYENIVAKAEESDKWKSLAGELAEACRIADSLMVHFPEGSSSFKKVQKIKEVIAKVSEAGL